MTSIRFLFPLIIIFILATFIFVSPVLANNEQENVSSNVTSAENAIISAYRAVLEAEQAGANVTDLLAKLNKAGEDLAVARMLYRNGDFDRAIDLANSSRNIGEEVQNAAHQLRDLTWNEGVQRMWFTMLSSVFGIILVVLGSLWVWRFLKRRYP